MESRDSARTRLVTASSTGCILIIPSDCYLHCSHLDHTVKNFNRLFTKMASFQDRAQHAVAQLDKEVRFVPVILCVCVRCFEFRWCLLARALGPFVRCIACEPTQHELPRAPATASNRSSRHHGYQPVR